MRYKAAPATYTAHAGGTLKRLATREGVERVRKAQITPDRKHATGQNGHSSVVLSNASMSIGSGALHVESHTPFVMYASSSLSEAEQRSAQKICFCCALKSILRAVASSCGTFGIIAGMRNAVVTAPFFFIFFLFSLSTACIRR